MEELPDAPLVALAWRLAVLKVPPEEDEEDEVAEISVRVVPLFSQVSGGPDTWMLFEERPMVVGRTWRTVPKSQPSSWSPLPTLWKR